MIILSNTTDKIEVVLGGTVATNQLQCMTSWRDITTTAYTPGRTVTNTNNATAVNIVPSPASSTQRVVDMISVYNSDTAIVNVTIKYDANGTEYILFSASLAANEKIEYTDGTGFKVFTTVGSVKNITAVGASSVASTTLSTAVLSSDTVNSNAVANTMIDTGLAFPVTNGNTYYFRAVIAYDAAATTTGSRWGVNGPGGTIRIMSNYSLTTTTITNNQGISANDTPAASSATSAATTGNIAIVEGFYAATANGDLKIRFASEVSSSAITAKAGSIIRWQTVI